MQPLGIPASSLPAYRRALRAHGFPQVDVSVLDLDGGHLASVAAQARQWRVLVDRHSKIAVRALRIVFDDPSGSIVFDPDSPATSLYFTQMLQLSVGTWVPELDDLVTAVPFTGPITAFERSESRVYVEAHSKDALAREPAWEPTTLLKGTPKDEAIRTLLESAGETQFALPDLSSEVLRRTVSVDRLGDRWAAAESIAASMDLQLHPRGDGYIEARTLPTTPTWTFSTADAVDDPTEADVLDTPRVRRSTRGLANIVEVLGPMPRAGQARIRGLAVAPESHPSSPESFMRGGVPGRRVRRKVLPHLRSNAQAQAIAERILEDALLSGVSPKFAASAVYPLEEGDVAELQTRSSTVAFRLDRFALGPGSMIVGYHNEATADGAA